MGAHHSAVNESIFILSLAVLMRLWFHNSHSGLGRACGVRRAACCAVVARDVVYVPGMAAGAYSCTCTCSCVAGRLQLQLGVLQASRSLADLVPTALHRLQLQLQH